ncbi:hypothetical protein ATN79_47355 [Paraburkholderia caribensis]|nr:hypothetical protein ATN79_47355 [Paraburkholderia caribensis]
MVCASSLATKLAWTRSRSVARYRRTASRSYIVDPASISVERHKRRAKTDRLDAIKLVINLCGGYAASATAHM